MELDLDKELDKLTQMRTYVEDMEPAVSGLFNLIKEELKKAKELGKEVLEINHERLKTLENDPFYYQFNPAYVTPFDDDLIPGGEEAQFFRWMQWLQVKEALIKRRIEYKLESMNTLAGCVLQIAKQGLSMVYGKDAKKWPQGRKVIGEIHLKDFIQWGRNYAMHYEEFFDKERRETSRAYQWITEQLNPVLKQNKQEPIDPFKNESKRILDLLGWNSYEDFKRDMLSLANEKH